MHWTQPYIINERRNPTRSETVANGIDIPTYATKTIVCTHCATDYETSNCFWTSGRARFVPCESNNETIVKSESQGRSAENFVSDALYLFVWQHVSRFDYSLVYGNLTSSIHSCVSLRSSLPSLLMFDVFGVGVSFYKALYAFWCLNQSEM